ncbi:hypothetical protein [Ralstonia chuxiongensis]|uniref:Uncharacterized protein n=1 Tax=Ralstonia chuxiongensis TaxID=2957504 RepID=A0AA41WV63_9RALS|nr:hypothetical protein [Ralstonia chuxiongensis]MCP1173007.1 hypothetical protein [Ralstonia chuxiongensis]
MRYSDRLLQEIDGRAHAHRAGVVRFAADLDAIGEILATAPRHGIHRWGALDLTRHDTRIVIWTDVRTEHALLELLLSQGAIKEKIVEHNNKLQITLALPSVTAPVIVFAPVPAPDGAQTMHTEVAA